ncbi:MAG TPA: hypothetical protein VLB72_12215 [Burkholderiales bacterium]|nr:hypothetical protein [Burkholderiales bacterium]
MKKLLLLKFPGRLLLSTIVGLLIVFGTLLLDSYYFWRQKNDLEFVWLGLRTGDLEFIPYFLLFTLIAFLTLSGSRLVQIEAHLGWKRLSLLIGGLAALIALTSVVVSNSGLFYSVPKAVAAVLSWPLAAWSLGILMVLGGKRIVRWIAEGFGSRALDIDATTPQDKRISSAETKPPIEHSPPTRLSQETARLVEESRLPAFSNAPAVATSDDKPKHLISPGLKTTLVAIISAVVAWALGIWLVGIADVTYLTAEGVVNMTDPNAVSAAVNDPTFTSTTAWGGLKLEGLHWPFVLPYLLAGVTFLSVITFWFATRHRKKL